MRVLNENELGTVGGGNSHIKPLVENPQSAIGGVVNDAHEAYISFLERYVFPYIYYCF